jgi:hypothetical protein
VVKNEKINEIERTRVRSPPRATSLKKLPLASSNLTGRAALLKSSLSVFQVQRPLQEAQEGVSDRPDRSRLRWSKRLRWSLSKKEDFDGQKNYPRLLRKWKPGQKSDNQISDPTYLHMYVQKCGQVLLSNYKL